MKRALAAAAFATLIASASLAATAPAYVDKAVMDQTRFRDEQLSDSVRKPVETLTLAGVKPGMTVAELFPGGGYYSQLLSRVVGPKGHVYGIENAGWKESVASDQHLAKDLKNFSLQVMPFGQFTLREKVDVFWTTQNYHDLKIAKYGKLDMAAFNKKVFDSLKPGGVYFILDHMGERGMSAADVEKLHRSDFQAVVREVTAAGFQVESEASFLRNTTDDHKKSIFDPAVKGSTDQFALKFVKPKA